MSSLRFQGERRRRKIARKQNKRRCRLPFRTCGDGDTLEPLSNVQLYHQEHTGGAIDLFISFLFLLQLRLLLSFSSNPPLLLAFQLVVKQEKRFLISFRSTNNGEHTFASFIVRRFGNRDLGTRKTSDFCDFCSVATDDTPDHVRGDGNVLCAEIGRWLRRYGGVNGRT